MGIGDVTLPLVPAVISAMHEAVDEMARKETFKGYGPEQGYEFLRHAIAENDFRARGVEIAEDEIFVSDGAKSDCGNIGDILSVDNIVAVCDPVYPVYVDTNAMAGRAGDYDEGKQGWTKIHYMPTTAENGFSPALPEEHGGRHLPLLTQQPYRYGAECPAAQGLGGLRQRPRVHHPL